MTERLEDAHNQLEDAQKKLQALNATNLTFSTKYRQAESQLRAMQLQLGKTQDEPLAIKDQVKGLEVALRQSASNQRVSSTSSFTSSVICYQIYSVTEHFSRNAISSFSLINCADGGRCCGEYSD